MNSETRTGASRHFVLAAGGTGGHLIPAFALAAELDARGHHVALARQVRQARREGDSVPEPFLREAADR